MRCTPLGAILLAALGLTPATSSGQSPDVPTTDEVARIVTLREGLFSERRTLLAELRRATLARAEQTAIDALITSLREGSIASQAAWSQWLAERGGEVVQSFWIVPAAAIRVPRSMLTEIERHPDVTAVCRDEVRDAHIKVATNALNSNADRVQTVWGERGAGANLALLDSGIDLDVAGTGTPHPAFDRTAPQTGTRILQALGIAAPSDFEDQNGHGSAVAGIALAIDWNGPLGKSDDGFAPAAGLASYKVTTGSLLALQESDVVAAWQRVVTDAAALNLRVAVHSYSGDPDPTSPAQQALDQAALAADLLVITSAGNGGQNPVPGQASQANASGIAVGAASADIGQLAPHQVLPFSTAGPLPGDGARYFPDLVASGDSVVSVQIDVPNGITFNQGTSFSAPQVAGTALLLRSRNPSFSALDTKALILNNVEDVSVFNPGKSRFHYGLGLLRTDLAFEASTQGTLLGGQLDLSQQQTEMSFAVAVQAGRDYAATVAWPRTDPAQRDWDNLDLVVLDNAGVVVAVSATPRNLYERALFQPLTTGTYTLKVIGSELTTAAALPFSLAFGENRGGGRQAGAYDLFDPACGTGGPCLGTAPDPAKGAIVPAIAASAPANARTRVPFSYYTTRLQQAYPGPDIPSPTTVDRIAFRRDEQQWDTPGYDVTLEVYLGYTTKSPGSLDPVFQNNISGAMTKVVATRTVRFPGTRNLPAGPEQFDFSVPLDAPFVVTTSPSLHLLMEVRVFSHTMGNVPFDVFFDAVQGPSVGRVYTDGQPTATAGVVDDLAIVASLMGPGLPKIAPDLQSAGRPQLGETFAVVLRHAARLSPAVLVHGSSKTSWGGFALPIDLALLNAPGCCLITDSVINLPIVTDANGIAEVPYLVPLNAVFTGLPFYNQFIVLDVPANALGLTMSNGGAALIGG